MTTLKTAPQVVFNDGQGAAVGLADGFPTFYPEPERLVYEYVNDSTRTRLLFPEDPAFAITLPTSFNVPPALDYYGDGRETTWDPTAGPLVGPSQTPAGDESPIIPVVRGWPAYPGKVPQIGVALGNEAGDAGDDAEAGGFIGDLYALDVNSNVVGSASYYAYPMVASVVVELIHEDRDERDRLHMQLRRLLTPLRRRLPYRDPRIHQVALSAEKHESDLDAEPYVMYVSLFTLEVSFEMWQPVDVVGNLGVIATVATTLSLTALPNPTY